MPMLIFCGFHSLTDANISNDTVDKADINGTDADDTNSPDILLQLGLSDSVLLWRHRRLPDPR